MTTATEHTPAAWPTEERLEEIDDAFQLAYNELEDLALSLSSIPSTAGGVGTLEAIGRLYSFTQTLDTQLAQCRRLARRLATELRDLDCERLDAQHRARRVERSGDAN